MVVNMDGKSSEAADAVKREVKLVEKFVMIKMKILGKTGRNFDNVLMIIVFSFQLFDGQHLQGGGAPVPPTDPLVAAHLDRPRFLSLCIKLWIIVVKFTILFFTKPRSPRALKSLSPYFPST